MGRYDKYDPKAGGFRAPLEADWLADDVNTVIGVGLNASGHVVKGAGQTGVVGILLLTKVRRAGEVVDVMTAGEVTDVDLTAGTAYAVANADGALGTTGDVYVGHTVESSRLVVRLETGRSLA